MPEVMPNMPRGIIPQQPPMEPQRLRSMEQMQRERSEPEEPIVTDTLRPAGIQNIHIQPANEIAEWLANVLKARRHVKKIEWLIGDCVKITYEKQQL